MEPESLTSSEAGFAHARGEIERVVFDSALGDGDVSRIMSGVLFLRDYAPLQANYPMEKLTARIAPSLPLGQFHYYVDGDGLPIGFCNWAWLSPAILDDVLTSGRDLYDDEFRCGDRPLFYEFLAPFGHGRTLVRDLRGLPFFKGRCIPAIRAKVGGDQACVARVASFNF